MQQINKAYHLFVAAVLATALLAAAGCGAGAREYTYEKKGMGQTVLETGDGYVVLSTQPAGQDSEQWYLHLTGVDKSGTVQWEKTYEGAGKSMAQAADGGLVITGEKLGELLLMKTDARGEVEWEKTFGGYDLLYGDGITATRDGGYIITGHACEDNQYDLYVLKTDASGEAEWTKFYGGEDADYGYTVRQLEDGSYVVVGESASFTDDGNTDVYLLKLDEAGEVEWERTYGHDSWDVGHSLELTPDGGFIVAGFTTSLGAGQFDIYLLKIDASGSLEWEKAFGGALRDVGMWACPAPGGGYAVAGWTQPNEDTGPNIYLLQVDDAGEVKWEKKFGGEGQTYGQYLLVTAGGEYVIVGGKQDDSGLKLYLAQVKP